MFIVAFTTESGYILGLGAISADGKRWMRLFCPGTVNGNLPSLKAYKTRNEAKNHARSVLRWAKKNGVLSPNAGYAIIPVTQ